METDYNLTSQKIETVQLRFDFHIEKLHDYIFALVSKNWFSIVILTSWYFLQKENIENDSLTKRVSYADIDWSRTEESTCSIHQETFQ